MNNEQNNGSSTSNAVVAFEFPRVQDVAERSVVKFGDRQEVLRISDTATVSIDAYWFTGPKVLKLKKIKPALAGVNKAGNRMPDGKEYNAKWFDANVRDPFHKVLRYAAKHSLEKGEPVSVGFSRRTNKATGEQVVTAKHGFEFITKPAAPKAVADEAAKLAEKTAADAAKEDKKSETRARRQSRKSAKLNPVIPPERVNAIDAAIAENAANKVNGEAVPAVNGEQTK